MAIKIDDIWNYTVGRKNIFDKPSYLYNSVFIAPSSDRNPATYGSYTYTYYPNNRGIVIACQVSLRYTCHKSPIQILVNGTNEAHVSGTNYDENGWNYSNIAGSAEVRPGDKVEIVFPPCGGGDTNANTFRSALFILSND